VEVWERTGLMDLWRLGQGPDGLDRLLSDAPGPEGLTPAPTQAAGSQQPKMPGEDVILAILHASGGKADRQNIYGHEAWVRAGFDVTPDNPIRPSTVTRAGNTLIKACLITRTNGLHEILPAARDRAATAAATLSLAGDGSRVAHVRALEPTTADAPTTAADVERQAEMAAEANA
jgi:hypothetical protein